MPDPLRMPTFLSPGDPVVFPDPETFDSEGLVAVGGDLTPARVVAAYRRGIFPWYAEGYIPMWWSPDPRGCFTADRLHVGRSLAKVLRQGGFQLTWNQAFGEVMEACAARRRGGTWIIPEMLDAYQALHELGRAHSLEVWIGSDLVAGVYGVQVGSLFAAESKFYRRTDMSKVALVALVRSLDRAGVELVDVQFVTDHLATLGAFAVTRREYLKRLDVLRDVPVDLTELRPDV